MEEKNYATQGPPPPVSRPLQLHRFTYLWLHHYNDIIIYNYYAHAIMIVEILHVVTFMFDGVVVAEPFLLYHDEISVGTSATSGKLTCTVESSSPVWRDVVRNKLNPSSSTHTTQHHQVQGYDYHVLLVLQFLMILNIMDCGVVYNKIKELMVS